MHLYIYTFAFARSDVQVPIWNCPLPGQAITFLRPVVPRPWLHKQNSAATWVYFELRCAKCFPCGRFEHFLVFGPKEATQTRSQHSLISWFHGCIQGILQAPICSTHHVDAGCVEGRRAGAQCPTAVTQAIGGCACTCIHLITSIQFYTSISLWYVNKCRST